MIKRYFQKGFTLIELMITVAIIGVLASIAIPMYDKYILRTQMSEGFVITAPAKTSVALICQLEGRLPTDNADAGLPIPKNIFGDYSDNVVVEDGKVIVEFGKNAVADLHGEKITFTPSACSNWQCSGTPGIAQYLPNCSTGTAGTAAAKPSKLNDPNKGESFCKANSNTALGKPGGIRSKYLSSPKKGQTAKDVLVSQLTDMGCNTVTNSFNKQGWNQFYAKRAGDGSKCRAVSCNKSYGYMPGGNDKWVKDLLTDTITEIGVSKDSFDITVTSKPGQKLKDQTVGIKYKDSNGDWKEYSFIFGDTGMGETVDWKSGTIKN